MTVWRAGLGWASGGDGRAEGAPRSVASGLLVRGSSPLCLRLQQSSAASYSPALYAFCALVRRLFSVDIPLACGRPSGRASSRERARGTNLHGRKTRNKPGAFGPTFSTRAKFGLGTCTCRAGSSRDGARRCGRTGSRRLRTLPFWRAQLAHTRHRLASELHARHWPPTRHAGDEPSHARHGGAASGQRRRRGHGTVVPAPGGGLDAGAHRRAYRGGGAPERAVRPACHAG